MIWTAVCLLLVVLLSWRFIKGGFNPLAHWLNTGADNETVMHEGELGKLLAEAGEYYVQHQWQSAERGYLQVLKLDHTNLVAYRRLGLIYTYLRNYEDAAESLEIVLRRAPTAADYQNYATIRFHQGHPDQAAAAMEQAFELGPSVKRALSLARLQAAAGYPDKQHAALRQAVSLDPDDVSAQQALLAWQHEHGRD